MRSPVAVIAVLVILALIFLPMLLHAQVASPYEFKKQEAWRKFSDFCYLTNALKIEREFRCGES